MRYLRGLLLITVLAPASFACRADGTTASADAGELGSAARGAYAPATPGSIAERRIQRLPDPQPGFGESAAKGGEAIQDVIATREEPRLEDRADHEKSASDFDEPQRGSEVQ